MFNVNIYSILCNNANCLMEKCNPFRNKACYTLRYYSSDTDILKVAAHSIFRKNKMSWTSSLNKRQVCLIVLVFWCRTFIVVLNKICFCCTLLYFQTLVVTTIKYTNKCAKSINICKVQNTLLSKIM